MTAPPLTIRNLTATPLELKLIERYEAPGHHNHKPKALKELSHFARNVTTHLTDGPSAEKLSEHAKSFAQQDVSVRIEPFQTVPTDIKATEREPHEILRLTFENDGQRYRIDVPFPTEASQALTPLAPDPHRHYTGIFIPKDTFLSIHSSANLQCWMRELYDKTPISGLSIPGTHNSPTYHRALPSVRCQAVSPRTQLDNGVRFFDIRVQPDDPGDPSNDKLVLVHGVFPISLTGNKYFRDLVNDVLDFLAKNPSETLIMSIKREGQGNATDQQLSLILKDHYCTDPSKWYTEPRIPRLGEARGKIVLMRRFALDDRLKGEWDGRGWGLDAENWAYNTPNDTHGAVCVQDFCEVLETENIEKKVQFAEEHLCRSGSCHCPVPGITTDAVNPVPPPPIYLNFLSASNFWKVGCWPERIAAKLNPAIIEFLCKRHPDAQDGDGITGIVVCDWVGKDGDWDLVRCIVGMNSRLELKQRSFA